MHISKAEGRGGVPKKPFGSFELIDPFLDKPGIMEFGAIYLGMANSSTHR